MPEPASPEAEAEFQRLEDMAEQLRAALTLLKEQIDKADARRAAETNGAGAEEASAPEDPAGTA